MPDAKREFAAMTYKRCCACDFWVTAQDKRCPNCGIFDPRGEREETMTFDVPLNDGTRALFGGVVGMMVFGFLMGGMGIAVGVAVGVSLGVLLGADKDWTPQDIAANMTGRRSVTGSLRQDEDKIQERLGDIAQREKRLQEVRGRVGVELAGSDRWEKVTAALHAGAINLGRQRERYHAKLWEIALVRWQNTLEPMAADWEALTHEECNHRLRQLELARARGAAYLKDWENVDANALPEGRRCIERLRMALETCDKLREALIVQQAALAVRGIAPMDDALAPTLTPTDALRGLDALNARAAIGEFNSAFGELEAEYARLRSEEELAESAVMVRRLG